MIVIGNHLIEEIRRRAQQSYPNECVGALVGHGNGGNGGGARYVVDVLPLDNRRGDEAARRRYLVSAEDYRALERRGQERGLDVIGFWHSHPDHPAEPSEYDRKNALPWYSYVIVAVRAGGAGEIRCWQLSDDRSRFDACPISPPGTIEVSSK